MQKSPEMLMLFVSKYVKGNPSFELMKILPDD